MTAQKFCIIAFIFYIGLIALLLITAAHPNFWDNLPWVISYDPASGIERQVP